MMGTTGARLSLLLADKQPGGDTGGQGPDFGKASPVALVVILLLLIAVVLLVRSMSKHLKRAQANLGGDDVEQDPSSDEQAGEGAQTGNGQRVADGDRELGSAGARSTQGGETVPPAGTGDSEAENSR